jgi:outer membrane protein TolC
MIKGRKNTIWRPGPLLCCAFFFAASYTQAQTVLTLTDCYTLARSNYPMVKQMALIEKTKSYSVANAAKGYLPQIAVSGQATYQSEVTKIPISIPNIEVPSLSKDQYKIYAEVNQSLTDAYMVSQQKELARANAATENQKLEVELYKLKERINQLYFGILLIDAQVQQTVLLKKDIQSGIDRTNAAIANGVAFRSSAELLQAELLKADQRAIELKANRRGFADMLALFIHQPVNENTQLETPGAQIISPEIKRPELELYTIQKKGIAIQNKMITAKNIPRLGLFFQGGYGRPALNFLKNDLTGYYIGGLRLNWNLSGFYTFRGEKLLLNLSQNSIDIQQETFLLNTNIALAQQNSEVSRYEELIATDSKIISLREKVKATANSQLENGTITTIDFLTYVNTEDQAKQNLLLHQVQLLMAQYNYQTTTGN